MDELDQEILTHLKEDSRRSVTEISKTIGRSHSATRVRLANLIDSGIISRFTIELADYDDDEVPRAFVDVILPHGAKPDRIASALSDIGEVTDMSLVTGTFNCQILIQCEAVSRIQSVAEVIQERLGARESRVRVVTGSIPGYPKVNAPVFLSNFTKGNSETEDNGNTSTTPYEEPVIAKATPNVTPTSSTGWALITKPPEEKIVEETRPVIGAQSGNNNFFIAKVPAKTYRTPSAKQPNCAMSAQWNLQMQRADSEESTLTCAFVGGGGRI